MEHGGVGGRDEVSEGGRGKGVDRCREEGKVGIGDREVGDGRGGEGGSWGKGGGG